MQFHKKIRLNEEIYKQEYRISSITICAIDKKNIFISDGLNSAIINLIKEHAKKYNIFVYAYCLMPDHLHLLIVPSKDKSIIDFIREIKSLSTKIAWKKGFSGSIWQRSFYDHFVRKEENIEKVVEYILNNPVRKGLSETQKEYKYMGSLIYNM